MCPADQEVTGKIQEGHLDWVKGETAYEKFSLHCEK